MASVTFRLEVATPDRLLITEAVKEATIPGEQGYMGILPGHAPLLSELGAGELSYVLVGGERRTVIVQGGFVEVGQHHVRVLADSAEHPHEIDVARAEAALRRATERIANPLPGMDVARALNAVKRAKARLAAKRASEE